MGELVQAVDWLHTAGWAHRYAISHCPLNESTDESPSRDLKPANLLLTARGQLLLTDFGSAAPLFSVSSVAIKHARTLVGTPDYLAPEVLRLAESVVEDSLVGEDDGERRAYGSEVDSWSLGVLTYEVSTFYWM